MSNSSLIWDGERVFRLRNIAAIKILERENTSKVLLNDPLHLSFSLRITVSALEVDSKNSCSIIFFFACAVHVDGGQAESDLKETFMLRVNILILTTVQFSLKLQTILV